MLKQLQLLLFRILGNHILLRFLSPQLEVLVQVAARFQQVLPDVLEGVHLVVPHFLGAAAAHLPGSPGFGNHCLFSFPEALNLDLLRLWNHLF